MKLKAIVNIGLRCVELQYSIKIKDLIPFSQEDRNKHFKHWELSYSKTKIKCEHSIWFDNADEWQTHILFDGKTIDFHYDYEERKEFNSKKDWGNYIFQGYEYIDGEPQLYDNNIVKQVVIEC